MVSKRDKDMARRVHTGPTGRGKRWGFVGAGLLVALVVWGVVASQPADDRAGNWDRFALSDADPFLGDPDAPVVIVAFETPMCPGCRAAHLQLAPQWEEEFISTGQAVLTLKQFSVTGEGPGSYDLRVGTGQECAMREGGSDAYWAFTDHMYGDYATGAVDDRAVYTILEQVADEEGLDFDALAQCYVGQEERSRVQQEMGTGFDVGVTGTPTYFVFGPEGKAHHVGAMEVADTVRALLGASGA